MEQHLLVRSLLPSPISEGFSVKYLPVVLLLCSLPAFGDSVFAFQNGSATTVNLATSPTLNATFGGPNPLLVFGLELPAGTGLVTLTFTLGPESFFRQFQWNGSNCSPCIEAQAFQIARNLYSPTSGIFTVNANGITDTYNFSVVEAVPEPATLALFGSGLVGVLWRKFKSKNKK